jgi:hypothetical protein
MIKAISNPKTHYLLGAGLDVLHFESKEWLETIALWKDEVKFFDNLLKKTEASGNKNPDHQKMLKDLEDSIAEHEQLLSKIIKAER